VTDRNSPPRALGSLNFRGHDVTVCTDDRGLWVFPGHISARIDLADIRVMFREDVTLTLWREMLNNAIRTAGRPVLGDHRPWAA
jgi:hypothetical protein